MRNLSAYDSCACGRDKAKHARMCITCRRDPFRTRPMSARFEKRLPDPRPEGCWEWQGKRNAKGYGVLAYAIDKQMLAHRLSWELHRGPIPAGIGVLHHCDNPPCVKTEPDERFPDGHLFLGTQRDNMRDAARKSRLYKRSKGDKRDVPVSVELGPAVYQTVIGCLHAVSRLRKRASA